MFDLDTRETFWYPRVLHAGELNELAAAIINANPRLLKKTYHFVGAAGRSAIVFESIGTTNYIWTGTSWKAVDREEL